MLFAILISLLFFSCGNSSSIILWSDKPELADAVELYNMNGSEYRVIFQYKEDLVSSFFKEETKPDIIIGEDLSNSTVKNELIDLNEALKSGTGFADLLTTPLISGTERGEEYPLVPLSYSPLTIVYRKNSKRIEGNSIFLNINEILDLGIQFNEEKKRGYSPYWDENFLLAFLDLNGTSFREGKENLLEWNREALESSTDFLGDWQIRNGGLESMDAFNSKYLYDNRIKLLKEGRILFSAYNLGDYMALSDSMIRILDFSYVSYGEKMHPGVVVYGGINKKNRSLEQSALFMNWLLEKGNQELIISSAIRNGTGSFGFLGGLSSFDDVNRGIITAYYPVLEGKIPFSSYLHSEPEKPVEYKKVQNELITRWLRDERKGSAETLDVAFDKWRKLRIPF